jgi:hypothetical protein
LLGEVSVTDKKVAPAALVEAVKEFEAKSGDTPAA